MYIAPKIQKLITEFDFNNWLNRALTKDDTNLLCSKINLPSYSNGPCKWTTLKKYLLELNFEIKHTKKLIDSKQKRVYIIKKEQP